MIRRKTIPVLFGCICSLFGTVDTNIHATIPQVDFTPELDYNGDKIVPMNTGLLKIYSHDFGDNDKLARQIYKDINKKYLETYQHKFKSQKEAKRFVEEFNTNLFPSLDFFQNNGITLDGYEDGVATFSINDDSYTNMEIYELYVELASEITSESDSKEIAISKINNWYLNNVSSSDCIEITEELNVFCYILGIGCSTITGTWNDTEWTWNKIYTGDTSYYLDVTANINTKENRYDLHKTLWKDHAIVEK